MTSEAQIEAFEDIWHWNEQAEHEFDGLLHQANTSVADMCAPCAASSARTTASGESLSSVTGTQRSARSISPSVETLGYFQEKLNGHAL
ncbi:MAG: hypothetical protein M3Y86_13510 [Verrucomicrobiota bacterium]|nr:hypothetical protein [Verrucomicrobiota bacterium]